MQKTKAMQQPSSGSKAAADPPGHAASAAGSKGERDAERSERIQRFDDKKEVVVEIRQLTSALGWGKDTLGKQFKACRSDHHMLLSMMRKEACKLPAAARRSYIESMLENDPRCRWVDYRGVSQVGGQITPSLLAYRSHSSSEIRTS